MKSAVLYISTLILLQYVDQGACFRDIPLESLPGDIVDSIVKIFMQRLNKIHVCKSPDTEEVKLLLYTYRNPKTPTVLNQSGQLEIDGDKPTVLIIHGWLSGPDSGSFPKIRNSYLVNYDYNIIMVDWSKTANTKYTRAYCSIPIIAKHVAQFLCLLDLRYNISLHNVHLVGHSLGGQMSGFIGQETMNLCRKAVGRITALDPAGPLFISQPPHWRLDSSDATYVQVIHTNGGIFGYVGACGHTDFYVNCGLYQTGCLHINFTLSALLSDITCSHSRSQEYMAESISGGNFTGLSCTACQLSCSSNIIHPKSARMGQNSSMNSTGGYVVLTNEKVTYAKYCGSIIAGLCL